MAVSVSTGVYRSMRIGEGFIDITPRIQRGFQRSLAAGISQIGAVLTKAISIPLAVVGGLAVKAAVDFEHSMTKITALTNASAKEVQEFSKIILREGPKWGQAPQDLAEAMFIIASSGEQGATALKTLEVAAKGTSVGLGEAEDLVKFATGSVAAYGAANMDSATALDILAAAGKESADAADEVGAAMRPVIPIAAALGVGLDETGAAMAALTRTLEPAQAGTALPYISIDVGIPRRIGDS